MLSLCKPVPSLLGLAFLICFGSADLLAQAFETTQRGPSREDVRTFSRALDCLMSLKDLGKVATLKEVLGALQARLDKDKIDLPIVVDLTAFGRGSAIYDAPISLPHSVRPVPVATVFRLVFESLPLQATYVLGPGSIEITTLEKANGNIRLRQNVSAAFDSVALEKALQRLSDLSGVCITIDPRVREEAKREISGTFFNSTLRATLVILSDMADLKAVFIDNSVYITNPERQKLLLKEQKGTRRRPR